MTKNVNLNTTVESNIEENSVASAKRDIEADSEIAKAQTDLSEINDNADNDL